MADKLAISKRKAYHVLHDRGFEIERIENILKSLKNPIPNFYYLIDVMNIKGV